MRYISGSSFNRCKLSLLKTGEGRSYQLAHHYGNDGDARVDAVSRWQKYQESPRIAEQQGINIPLETREQTIFSYQASAGVRAILNGQEAPQIQSRQETQPGKKRDVDVSSPGGTPENPEC